MLARKTTQVLRKFQVLDNRFSKFNLNQSTPIVVQIIKKHLYSSTSEYSG